MNVVSGKARKIFSLAAAVACAALLWASAQAFAGLLPGSGPTLPIPVKAPPVTVPVKPPALTVPVPAPPVTVPVKPPPVTVPVKSPPVTVPVKPPPVPVKLPPVPVKLPPVPVKPPPVPVKPPPVTVPVKPPPVKAPPVKAPPVSVPVKAPPIKGAPGKPLPVTVPSSKSQASGSTGSGAGKPGGSAPSGQATGQAPGGSRTNVGKPSSGASGSHGYVPFSSSGPSGAAGTQGSSGAPAGGYGTSGYGSSPLSGYGPEASPGHPLTPKQARVARARELAVKRLVAGLHGCLSALPERLRLVLELRTGIDVPRELRPTAVAAYLHVPVGQVSPLEMTALMRLRQSALSNACGGSPQTVSAVLASSYFGALGGVGPGAGGVEAAIYRQSPAAPGSQPRASAAGATSFLGITMPVSASSPLLWIIVGLAGVLLTGFLFAEGMGTGPSHRLWRQRWIVNPVSTLRSRTPRR